MNHVKGGARFSLLVLAFFSFCYALVMLIAPTSMAAVQDENLLTPLPPDFKMGFQASKPPMDMSEYVPKTETVDNWSKMVTVQIFHNLTNYVAADSFAGNVAGGWKQACTGSTVQKVTSGTENGYAFSVWMYTCPLNPQTGKPENMWLKAISGKDSLYSVQFANRLPLQKELIVEAMSYLRTVSVCDTRYPEHVCPKGMQPVFY